MRKSLPLREKTISLNKILNEVHLSEADKGNEVKLVRANLIEEIVRVQSFQQKNEDELRKENDVLSFKFSESIKKFKETIKKTEEENTILQNKIEEIIAENKKTERDLIFQINDLNRANNKLVKFIEDKNKTLREKSKSGEFTKRSEHISSFDKEETLNMDGSIEQIIASSNKTVEALEIQLKEKSEKWKNEKEKLLNEIEKREDIYAEKLALRDMEIEKLKNSFSRNRKLEETKNKTLIKENRILDKTIKDLNKRFKDKLKHETPDAVNKEVLQTKLDHSLKREKLLKSQIEELSKEVLQIQKSYESREKTYIAESKSYLDQIQKYQKMITDNKVKAIQKLDSEHYDVSKKLKKEIETLRNQIQVKDSIIDKLKDIENSDKRKERKDIQKLLIKFKEVIASCEDQIKQYSREQPGINQMLLELNSKHNKAEEEILHQLAAAKQEIVNQKEKVRIISEQDYNEIIRDLQHQLMYSNNELDHAKRNLIEYITSLNQLEDLIKENQSLSISENDEIERLRLENHRLNEENSSLIESKKQIDKYFNDEVEKLK